MALLAVQHLTRRFGGVVALDDVSFTVAAGDVAGVIGPNGAGKTTLFNLITRFELPDGGDVVFAGRSLRRASAHETARLGIARTFQGLELFTGMTVSENVLVGRHVRTRFGRKADERRRVGEVLELVGLPNAGSERVSALPHRLQKRVALARALAAEPQLLLLDEPAAGLDHEEVANLAALLRRLRDERRVTVVLVEHHVGLVMGISDVVHVLDFGRRIASGTPDDVRADPAVADAYLGAG